MALHDRDFQNELFIEHIEEATFLYETRLNWLEDSEIGWLDLEAIDQRIEAHLDALIVGGDAALGVCYSVWDNADPSELHILLRVFFRHRDATFLKGLWKSFDFSDEEKVRCVADAFKWECPEKWREHLTRVFSGDGKELFPLLAPCIAYRFRDQGQSIAGALTIANPVDRCALLSSLSMCSRSSSHSTKRLVRSYLECTEVGVRSAAVLYHLMHGDRAALKLLLQEISTMPRVSAIAGNGAASRSLIEAAKMNSDNPELIFSLGLSGNLSAVPLLLSLLDNDNLAGVAVEALNLICGANLYEDVHIPDDVEEDELFEHEKEPFRQGELPKNINDEPYGAEVNRLIFDKEIWNEWIQTNKDQFKKGLRFRNGRVFTAMELVRTLVDNQSSYRVRTSAHQELIIRYGLDIQFAVDDLILIQKRQLNLINQWAIEIDSRLQAGRWYFDGADIDT